MGGDLAFFDIIFFALVAGFLILRLRSVLGRRSGTENRERWTPRLPTRGPAAPGPVDRPPAADNVTPLPSRTSAPAAAAAASGFSAPPLDQALGQIKAADPSFDGAHFVEGARAAFEMIVTAYAHGDTSTLRPLLADDVYENFSAAIRGRQDAKQTLETTLIGIKS